MGNIADFLKELTALSHKYGVILRATNDGHIECAEPDYDGAGLYGGGSSVVFWINSPSYFNAATEDKIRRGMERVVNGTWKVKTFYYWLIGKSWDQDFELANHVTLILAEWTSKHRTDEDVIHEFGKILTTS